MDVIVFETKTIGQIISKDLCQLHFPLTQKAQKATYIVQGKTKCAVVLGTITSEKD